MKAMTNVNILVGSITAILNSGLTDPISHRQGSFFFGPNDEINFQKYMPKGKVFGAPAFSDNHSYGVNPSRSKEYNIHVEFYTQRNMKDRTTGYKDEQLVTYFLEEIENKVYDNLGSLGQVVIVESRNEDTEGILQVPGMSVIIGRHLFVLRERRG